MRALLAVALVLAFAVPADAAVFFERSGTILAGVPTAFVLSACHASFISGVGSVCFDVPDTTWGRPFTLAFAPFAAGFAGICFLDGRDLLACAASNGIVPDGAKQASVHSWAGVGAGDHGVGMRWTFTVTDA